VDLSTGITTRTTTNPDLSTRIETTARDGTLLAISGTSVLPVRYTNGVASVGGVNRFYSQEIKLLTNGTDSAEWVKSVNDGLGRAIETQFPDNSTNRAIYNTQGQLASEVDPDGVVTLYSYNTLGELAYRALDVNRNGTIDLGGIDRVTATVSDVVSNATYGATVRRSSTYVWDTTNNATSTLISENASSVDGRQSWSTFNGLTSYSRMDYLGNGAARTTQTGPDGTQTIQDFQSGRLISSTTQNSAIGTLNSTTTGYDAHRRQNSVTDARTGTTTFTFDDLDRVLTVTTPAPAAGESAQVTTSVYDEVGRVIRTQAADGLWTTNEYYLTGLYRKTSGARVYPVEYTFDYAGRLGTMTTWQDYAGSAGAAVTQWKYDGARGFLTNKVYQGTNGPGYTYTKAGRLGTRTWARGLTTSYSYNNAGELAGADYSDGTPDVTYAYDRQGRPAQITGATTNDFAFTAAGLLLSENVVNKTWNYASQTRLGYDALQRRSGLTNLSLGLTHSYAYDAASRLKNVSTLDSGASSLVSYSYVSNSPLVGGITFQQGGTTRLTTSRSYDNLNRLRQINSVTNAQSVASFAYAYNAANQRTAVTNVDGSRWSFGYDQLGQVTNGTRFWSDGSRVAGQQFGFGFDTIGNRLWATTGGDTNGANLRTQTYSANALNQYTNRTVPGFVEVSGSVDAGAAVTVNSLTPDRQGEYYRKEVSVNNSASGVAQWINSRATNVTGTSVVARLSFTAQTPEASTYDPDGNLTQDGLWNYSWDAENRLTRVETRTNAITDSSYWQRVDATYDFASRRVRKQVYAWNSGASAYQLSAGLRYFYHGRNLVGQLDEITGTRISFVWGEPT
jgi:YD repeat-containing protein